MKRKALNGVVTLMLRCPKTNQEGTHKHKDCIFPFNFEGKSFDACINLDQADPTKYWCPTRLDDNRNFIVSKYRLQSISTSLY